MEYRSNYYEKSSDDGYMSYENEQGEMNGQDEFHDLAEGQLHEHFLHQLQLVQQLQLQQQKKERDMFERYHRQKEMVEKQLEQQKQQEELQQLKQQQLRLQRDLHEQRIEELIQQEQQQQEQGQGLYQQRQDEQQQQQQQQEQEQEQEQEEENQEKERIKTEEGEGNDLHGQDEGELQIVLAQHFHVEYHHHQGKEHKAEEDEGQKEEEKQQQQQQQLLEQGRMGGAQVYPGDVQERHQQEEERVQERRHKFERVHSYVEYQKQYRDMWQHVRSSHDTTVSSAVSSASSSGKLPGSSSGKLPAEESSRTSAEVYKNWSMNLRRSEPRRTEIRPKATSSKAIMRPPGVSDKRWEEMQWDRLHEYQRQWGQQHKKVTGRAPSPIPGRMRPSRDIPETERVYRGWSGALRNNSSFGNEEQGRPAWGAGRPKDRPVWQGNQAAMQRSRR